MPTFRFQLTNPRIHLETKEDSDKWSLSFDATIERPERDHHGYRDSFEVICGGKKYDGFKLAGEVSIDLHPSPDRQDEEAELRTKLGYIRLNYMSPTKEFPEDDPPIFAIHTSLSPDTFFHLLQANPENCLIRLFIQTISLWEKDPKVRQSEGLVYGNDPNGKEYEWHTEKKWTACLSCVKLTITPRSEGASVSGPS